MPSASSLILCYVHVMSVKTTHIEASKHGLMGNLVEQAGQGINVLTCIISTVAVTLAAHSESIKTSLV